MAEPVDDYCVAPATELSDAHKATYEGPEPKDPHYTTEKKLMRPQTEQDNVE